MRIYVWRICNSTSAWCSLIETIYYNFNMIVNMLDGQKRNLLRLTIPTMIQMKMFCLKIDFPDMKDI